MKTKISLLLLAVTIFFACSKDDTTIETDSQNLITSSETQQRSPSFTCDPSWEAPTVSNWPPIGLIQIYYSQDPNDYPGGVVDVECTRQEFFQNYCELRMTVLQDEDPFHDTWKVVFEGICQPRPKDDVNTAANSDPRVCVGSACGD
ncbi:MAG: hypothetical protein AAFP76_08820 [Bacteroidota bacterium]